MDSITTNELVRRRGEWGQHDEWCKAEEVDEEMERRSELYRNKIRAYIRATRNTRDELSNDHGKHRIKRGQGINE